MENTSQGMKFMDICLLISLISTQAYVLSTFSTFDFTGSIFNLSLTGHKNNWESDF